MRRYIFLLIAITLLLSQTLPTIFNGRFTFAFDMGRDLLWVRNMVELKKPTLIGPWGSIAGVYFGPLWYYLLAIPYTIFNGDPRAAVAVPLAANLTAIIIGWLFLRRRQHWIAADVFALLYSASPMIVSLSSFAFHANLLPLTMLLFIIGLYEGPALPLVRPGLIKQLAGFPLSALSASISYHLEPAAGVMMTGFLGIWLIAHIIFGKIKINYSFIRLFAYSLILFIIPFIPQIIFELRHNFIQSKSLIAYFQGENTSLGGVLPLSERITERFFKISDTLSYSLLSNEVEFLKPIFAFIFLFACLTMGLLSRLSQNQNNMAINYSLLTINFLVFHYLGYTFLFLAELKSWYLSGFASLFILTTVLIIEKLFVYRRFLGVVAVAAFMLWNTNGFTKLIPKNNQTAAPETLTAQLEVVDWIYQDGLKSIEPFSVYTYTPPIYDYSYQYLIWWRGKNRYGKLPAQFNYLPDETSYLPEKEKFISADWKPQDAKIIYLIIEPETIEFRRRGWLGHFAALDTIDKTEFSSGVIVEKRYQL